MFKRRHRSPAYRPRAWGIRCPVCLSELQHPRAAKCTKCGSYQNRFQRSILSVQVPIALVAGILGLASLVLPVIASFLWPTRITYVGLTRDGQYIQAIVVNDTGAQAFLKRARLKGDFLDPKGQELWLANVGLSHRPERVGEMVTTHPFPLDPEANLLHFKPRSGTLDVREAYGEVGSRLTLHLSIDPYRLRQDSVEVIPDSLSFLCFYRPDLKPCPREAEREES